jgi:hypothetical protein
MADAATPGLFAVVEIMGRRTRAGLISDAQMGGSTLLRIEHPSRANAAGTEPETEYYAPSAIFAIRPCSQEEATAVAGWAWPAPRTVPTLGAPFGELVEGDGDDDDYLDDEDVS